MSLLTASATLLFASLACSGARSTSPGHPHGQSGAEAPRNPDAHRPSSEAGEASASLCEDGTCFDCGRGICPSGYYCDESVDAACSWLPVCVSKPTCDCLLGSLGPGCTCEERSHGLFVRCR